jgi:ring-1,2-phenylacetyl-CoA epoxidase subunit PaaD
MSVSSHISADHAWKLLETVSDPEIPVLSIIDLGVIRNIELNKDELTITITPTYSGCPAMKVIEEDMRAELEKNGYEKITVNTVLSPAWTTDWLTESGKEKLKAYGIAPPEKTSVDKNALFQKEKRIECPQCGSNDTKMTSQFGSTACKALYKCNNCQEPFDYFKCL